MNERDMLEMIAQALKDFQMGELKGNARSLLNTLGYDSPNWIDLDSNQADFFIETWDEEGKINRERARVDEWDSVDCLFQLTDDDLSDNRQTNLMFESGPIDNTNMESYLFFAIKLQGTEYNRTQLSTMTREINKLTPMPAMIIFQHAQTLTFAVIDRRLNRRDQTRDVLEKVSLIKDIDFKNPHPAHIRILFDLSRDELYRVHQFSSFVALHAAWKKTLDIQELNKKFYKELSDWYFWAIDNVTFPDDAEDDVEVRNATSIIRMITRLIFVWFIKERDLVPDDFF